MKKRIYCFAAVSLAVIVIFSSFLSVFAADDEYPVREGDFTGSPREGNIVVGIEGTFVTVDEAAKSTLLKRVNEIRKEACDEGVPYPNDRTKNLKSSDYVPLKWSGLIELVAAMRAVEASMCIAHQRLAKGHTSVWENNYGVSTNGENLAWNWESASVDAILMGIEQWYDEKADWINDTPDAVTGHYTSMINPAMKYIGLAGFSNPSARYRMTVTNQLSAYDGLDEKTAGVSGGVTQKIEVDPAYVEEMTVTGEDLIDAGQSVKLTARAKVTVTSSSGCGPIFTGVTWKSETPSVASVDASGTVTGLKAGTAKIKASLPTGKSAVFEIDVKQASEYTDKALEFSAFSVLLQSDFSMNFKTEQSYFESAGYDDIYCVFRMNRAERKVTDYEIRGGKIVFTFSDIAPDRLNDTVSATLYATKNGKSYEGATLRRSICDYCYYMINRTGENTLKTLLVDILEYASESQKYTGYKTDTLANARLTDEQKAYGTGGGISFRDDTNASYRTVTDPTVSWKGAGLALANSVCIRYRLDSADIRGLTVKIEDSSGNEWEYTSNDLVSADEGGYYLYFDGLCADQMRERIYATVYRNGEAVSNTMRYSIVSYVYVSYQQNGYSYLLASMLHYGDSAAAYVSSIQS